MAMRLHEIHPSLVHFPLTLLPAALVLDAAGQLTGRRSLMNAARTLSVSAAVTGMAAGVAGLIAQQTVRAEGEAHDALVTHRNLNLALLGATAALAGVRATRRRPGPLYLATGLAGVAAMSYTAYLGGKMVYAHGVGVEERGGVLEDQSVEIRRGSLLRALQTAVLDIGRGLAHIVRGLLQGEIAPLLRGGRNRESGAHRAQARFTGDKVEREQGEHYRLAEEAATRDAPRTGIYGQ